MDKTNYNKNIDFEELIQPEILDTISMIELKAGIAPNQDCECDHGACNGAGTTLVK
ncbi:hypothetical protein ACGE0T_01120 [Parabacteroides sp. APC149_11_2_Y6]